MYIAAEHSSDDHDDHNHSSWGHRDSNYNKDCDGSADSGVNGDDSSITYAIVTVIREYITDRSNVPRFALSDVWGRPMHAWLRSRLQEP